MLLDCILVVSVKAGSKAERDGLKAGDVIRYINGQLLKNAEEAYGKIDSLNEGKIISLTVKSGENIKNIYVISQKIN